MTAERSRWEEGEGADGRRTVNGGSIRSKQVHCTTIHAPPHGPFSLLSLLTRATENTS